MPSQSTRPSLPQGTRDFGPETVRKRLFILDAIRGIFGLYGYQPLETPAMEQLDTLMGKYGEEGDKLIFKILNNGLGDPKNIEKSRKAFDNVLGGKNDPNLTERALRYDLTIPFARYVAMNHNQLTLPFKRYQIQPVWRADRPQRGRYREFYQCDADVVGSRSLLNEVELASIYQKVFRKLRIPVTIAINHRKILAALADICGGAGKLTAITVAIDKLDKIGLEKVRAELIDRGLNDAQVATIQQYLAIDGPNAQKLTTLKDLFTSNPTGLQGVADLETILSYNPSLTIDLTLARGLNYYTGAIFEVKASEANMGSIGGGGRYDDLTGTFGVPGIPGVGISFGVDRIYDVMEEANLFPPDVHTGTKVLFFNLGESESRAAFDLVQRLRDNDIPAELYHETAKFEKQFKYAERKGIPFAAIIGSAELAAGTAKLKDLRDGSQKEISLEELTRSDLFR
ncbi:MAG TPA: histidine--tRNA ligase [Puia sp.]|jgi:histidyl-tRNA synthetase|nr:histidine--tRNA ligase [Puia sp.]